NGAVNLDADTAGCNLSRDLNHQVGRAAVVFGFRGGDAQTQQLFFRSCLWSRVWHLEILLSIANPSAEMKARESRGVPHDAHLARPLRWVPQRSGASAIASVGVPHGGWEVAMLAPLGGIGVVAPVPYTDRDFPQMPHGRGAYGDAPSPSCLRGLASASTPMRRA